VSFLTPEVLTTAISVAAPTLGGIWWLASRHSHPEYVRREELEGLRLLLEVQHRSILRELSQLRDSLDS
jgi:hypothetical protein